MPRYDFYNKKEDKYFDEFIVVENTKIHWKGDRASLLKKPTKLIKDLV